MEGFNSAIQGLEGEGSLIRAAQLIVSALETRKAFTADEWKALDELRFKLSTLSSVTASEAGGGGMGMFVERLAEVQEKVMNWDADQSMIWDSGPEESSEYLKTVEETQMLARRLECLSMKEEDSKHELLNRTNDVLHGLMARLEEEFTHLLIQNMQPFELDHASFHSNEEDTTDGSSNISAEDESFNEMPQRESIGRGGSEEFIVDLIRPAVIPDIQSISRLMIASKYEQECSRAFIRARKNALVECLHTLEIEKLSIEDVLRMEWGGLNSKIKRWVWAIKVFVRVYLASEKCLHDQIFGAPRSSSLAVSPLVEVSKGSMLQLLNFGEAVALSPRKPEKLFGLLDMHDVLANLVPDIEALFTDKTGSFVRRECHEVLSCLGDSARATFLDFKNAVASNPSVNPFAGGRVHPLTRYVMNYIRNLVDYSDTLNLLLRDHLLKEEECVISSPDMSPGMEARGDDSNAGSFGHVSSVTGHFHSLISILESNLHGKSKLYRDAALQQIFLMNNTWYMAEKVKNSELRAIFGDEWVRRHNRKFQQHAMNYERATWSSILSLLMDEGTQNSTREVPPKDRLRSFNAAFEEVYKVQTGWQIPDGQLREDLQISTSLKVIHAYRTFLGRNGSKIKDKNIKYGAEDLQNFLLDLFEGSARSLHASHRR